MHVGAPTVGQLLHAKRFAGGILIGIPKLDRNGWRPSFTACACAHDRQSPMMSRVGFVCLGALVGSLTASSVQDEALYKEATSNAPSTDRLRELLA